VGPAPSDSADDWSFRTLSAKKVFDATGDCDVMLDDNYVVHVLRKARPGPFANTILVGRSGTNDVCIAHSSISKLHARVRSTADGIWLSDAGSSNGTTLNGKKLAQGAEMPCSSGAHVLFGACGFQLFEPKHFHAILSRFRLI
jgi:pSer/pThr/pTyr-binding forkhead associated (FHA) protein